jgi:hypothetical protein
MALTRSFKDLVQRHVATDPTFAEALLREAIDTMLAGDVRPARRSCAIISKRQLVSRGSARRRAPSRRVSFVCLGREGTRRLRTSLACSAISNARPNSNCT